MQRVIMISLSLWVMLVMNAQVLAQNTVDDDRSKIKQLIMAYGKAMNGSNVQEVVALFTEDGVFMPAKEATAMGLKQIKAAFEHEFKTIDLDVSIVFDEIMVQGDFAVVRSRSDGKIHLLGPNKTVSTEAYRAFFVLKKVKNQWKIARFMFNFTRS